MTRMRIVVMGSGGTGGYFGAKLARAGEDVTFVARGAHRAAIEADGVRIRSAVEGDWAVRAPAVERLDGRPPADVVLFCVKSFDTEEAAQLIRPVVGPDTGVLSIQNGVDNEEKLARVLGAGHVLGGAVRVFATIEAPGVIRQRHSREVDALPDRPGAPAYTGARSLWSADDDYASPRTRGGRLLEAASSFARRANAQRAALSTRSTPQACCR